MSAESLRISVLSKLSHKPSNSRQSDKVIRPAQFQPKQAFAAAPRRLCNKLPLHIKAAENELKSLLHCITSVCVVFRLWMDSYIQARFQGRMRIQWVCGGFASSYSALVNRGCFLKRPRYVHLTCLVVSFPPPFPSTSCWIPAAVRLSSHVWWCYGVRCSHNHTNTQEGQPNRLSVVSLNYLQIHEAVKAARPGLMLSSVTCWILSQQGSGSINRYYRPMRFIETPGKGLALNTLLWLIFCQVTLAPKKSNANKVIAP